MLFKFLKNIVFFAISLFCISISNAQTLSPNAKFSLITISPGEELYSVFGHSAIRLYDPVNGIDWVYHYGAFDFRTEGFYVKFLRGTLPYQMSMQYFQDMYKGYQEENRYTIEQELNLSEIQRNKLYNLLTINYLPENREYHYKFFYDNCSTRLRDILQKTVGDSLKFSTTLHADSSYRAWIERYSHSTMPWSEFGMDIAIGTPSDEITGASNALFLPFNLADAFDSAKVYKNGLNQSLVAKKVVLNKHLVKDLSLEKPFFTPTLFCWLFFMFVSMLTFFQLKSSNYSFLFDKIFFTVAGLAGWILTGLWFFTDHGVTNYNFNIIWALPLLFPVALFLSKNKQKTWLPKFFLAYAILLILLLVAWKFLPQHLHAALIPLVLILALRAVFIYWKLGNN